MRGRSSMSMVVGHGGARAAQPGPRGGWSVAATTPEQASGLERWVREARGRASPAPVLPSGPRVVVVTGGKGGVGKSSFSLNFTLALGERGRRVLLVDGDSGLGNLDVLLGICPSRHLGHVLAGACGVGEAIVSGPGGLKLLPAASGLEAMGRATAVEVSRLLRALREISAAFDLCVLDTGAGLGAEVRALWRAGSEILVVTTPEPTALADAYATIKAIHGDNPRAETLLVVNMAEGPRDAEAAARSVAAVSRQFLDWSPRYLGYIPRDPAVARAVREQRPFLLDGSAPAARAVRRLAAAFCAEPPPRPAGLRALFLGLAGAGSAGRAGAKGGVAS
jgi:flagellar biosynthesis protein FlhG